MNLLGICVFLHGNDLIVSQSRKDRDGQGLSGLKSGFNFTTEVIGVIGELDIFTAVTLVVHEGAEIISGDIDERVLFTHDEGDVGSVGRRNDILVLLSGEDINGREVALGVTVLASLGGRHSGNLS